MLIVVFGPPSAFTQWGVHVLRTIADVVLADVDHVAACDLDAFREAWTLRQHSSLFVFADCPEARLVEIFSRANARILVLCEQPEDVVEFIMRERDMAWHWALRLCVQCMTTLGETFHNSHALIMRRSASMRLREFLDATSAHFGIEASSSQAEEILRRLGGTDTVTRETFVETMLLARLAHASPINTGLRTLPVFANLAVRQVLAPVKQIMMGSAVESLVWPRELFISGDQPSECLTGPIDLTGPTRCVCFGPYLNIPAGEWAVTLDFDLQENASGTRLEIDVYQAGVVTRETFRIAASGQFQAKARFEVTEPREAVQIRIIMLEGAIEGTLLVKKASLRRIHGSDSLSLGDDHAETSAWEAINA